METKKPLDSKPHPQDSDLAVTLTVAQLKELVRREVATVISPQAQTGPRKEWLKADELTQEYGLPKTWFEERGRAGDITRTRAGRYVLFKRADVEQYLESHRLKKGDTDQKSG